MAARHDKGPVMHIAFAAILILAADAPAPQAPSSAKPANAPPFRWWSSTPEQLVTPALRAFCARHPGFAVEAGRLAAACDARISRTLTANRAVLADHESEFVRVRRSLLDKSGSLEGFAGAYGEWKRRDAELFAPVRAALTDFAAALEDLTGETQTDSEAAAEDSGIGKPPDTDWADAESVEEVFDALPARPSAALYHDALARSLAVWKPNEELTAALAPALADADGSLRRLQREHAAALDRLEAVMRIIRKHPESIRRADLAAVEREWRAQVAPFRTVLTDFAAEVRRRVAAQRASGSRK